VGTGTHLDAPIHFAEGRLTADQIPLSRLVAPAVVIDVTTEAARTADYQLTAGDIRSWEQANGVIPRTCHRARAIRMGPLLAGSPGVSGNRCRGRHREPAFSGHRA